MHLFRLDVQNNAKFLVHPVFRSVHGSLICGGEPVTAAPFPFLLLIKGVHHLHHFLVIVTVQDILKDAAPFPAVAAPFCFFQFSFCHFVDQLVDLLLGEQWTQPFRSTVYGYIKCRIGVVQRTELVIGFLMFPIEGTLFQRFDLAYYSFRVYTVFLLFEWFSIIFPPLEFVSKAALPQRC